MEHNDNNDLPQQNGSYEIYAQNAKGKLMIKNIKENNFFIRSIDEIMRDQKLLNGFSKRYVDWMKTIAELEGSEGR
jgi:hypothetical protein